MNKDQLTNIAGAFIAVAGAIEPVARTLTGTLETKDILQLIMVAGMALVAYLTGKDPQGRKLT